MSTSAAGERVLSLVSILRHRSSLPTRAIARVLLESDGGPVEHSALWKLARRIKRVEEKESPSSGVEETAVERARDVGQDAATQQPTATTPILRSKTHFKRVLYQMKRMQTVEVRAEPLAAGTTAASRRRFLVQLTEKGLRKYTEERDALYKHQVVE
jgi:hypothetical protein